MKRTLTGLYLLTDERLADDMEAVVAAALVGGARLIQYRDKSHDAQRRRREAQLLRSLTRRHGALLLVNDDPLLAAAVDADGVHLGRGDPDIAAARRLLGAAAVIGVSCYADRERARAAAAAGADYVAFGSVYPSPTKPQAGRATLELIAAARTEIEVPVCAIGGINHENLHEVLKWGVDLVAVLSAILFAADVEAEARYFARAIETAH